jgi:hypothetical protein
MDEELKLGFHRLGRTFEDAVNLGLALVGAWAIAVLLVALAAAISLPTTILLILVGVGVIALSRGLVTRLAGSWRRGRLELERERGPATS